MDVQFVDRNVGDRHAVGLQDVNDVISHVASFEVVVCVVYRRATGQLRQVHERFRLHAFVSRLALDVVDAVTHQRFEEYAVEFGPIRFE